MFGPHVNRVHAAGGGRPLLHEHVAAAAREADDAAGFRVGAAAVFLSGPKSRAWTADAAERAALAAHVRARGLRLLVHSTYAAPPWGDDGGAAAAHVRAERRAAAEAGAEGLVVHLPRLPPADVAALAARLSRVDAADAGGPGLPRILLEMPGVAPATAVYHRPAAVDALFRALRAGPDPALADFGLCVDTAHLWTGGVALRSYADAAAWLAGLDAAAGALPPDCVALHLNDSARALGTGPDTHAALGAGHIWGGHDAAGTLRDSGLAAFVDHAHRHNLVAILERQPKDALAGDYRRLKMLLEQ